MSLDRVGLPVHGHDVQRSALSSAGGAIGSVNLLHWKCMLPGKAGTSWEKGLFPLELVFSEAYPAKPPECRFPKGFFHPNGAAILLILLYQSRNSHIHPDLWGVCCAVYPSGLVCLSIVNPDQGWKPAITVKQVGTFATGSIATLLAWRHCLLSTSWNATVDFDGHSRYAEQPKQQ